MAENEDIPYNVSEFATPETEKPQDPDQPNKSVILETIEYLNEQIAKHSSLDVITPEAEKIMTTQQQVVVHKEVVAHLISVRTILKDKAKELV